MADYAEALRYLFSHDNYEFTPLDRAPAELLDLRRMHALLDRLGNPERGRHAGQSCGSARQRQPVRRTDRLACTPTRRFPSRGRPQPAARRGRSTSGVRRAPCSAVSALG